MEKGNTIASNKRKPDDSSVGEKDGGAGDGVDNKKDQNAEKVTVDKEEGVPKNDLNSKKERTSVISTTPKTSIRSTRSSNNPEFVAKQRHFLQKVNQGVFYQSEEEGDSVVTNGSPSLLNKRKRSVSGGPHNAESGSSGRSSSSADFGTGSINSPTSSNASGSKPSVAPKKRKNEVEGLTRDIFCWVCHKDVGATAVGTVLSCEVCLRVYHARCCHNMDSSTPRAPSPVSTSSFNSWACPECVKIVKAETMGTRSRAMQLISMDQLCALLKHVLIRVRSVTGAEPFFGPVDLQEFPRYREFVANPMDLGLIERNIRRRTYGSTEAFFADIRWVLHNSIIFNTQHSKLTSIARTMVKVCRQELSEIENCPDCYANAHTGRDNWFIEVCRRPHILLWAKLKGFPHWPAKAMRLNKEGCVDVRFFGAHDRAWVPAKDCFLYSEEMPAPPKNRKKNNLDGCIMEVEDHIKKLKEKYEIFMYAPFRTVFDPLQEDQIIMKMLPKYQPMTLETPKVKQNRSPEQQMSRDSPSISAGTEEESEEDQSIDGDDHPTSKRTFDSTFEDSMEVPSGCETSLLEVTSAASQSNKIAEKGTKEEEKAKEEKEDAKEEEANGTENEEEEVNGTENKEEKEDDAETRYSSEVVDEPVEDSQDSEVAKEVEVKVEKVDEKDEEKEATVEKDEEKKDTAEKDEEKEDTLEKDKQIECETLDKEVEELAEVEMAEGSVSDVDEDKSAKLGEESKGTSIEVKEEDALDEEVEDKEEKNDINEAERPLKKLKPLLEEEGDSVGSFEEMKEEVDKSQDASAPAFNQSLEKVDEDSIFVGNESKDSCRSLWANMPVDDDVRLSTGGNLIREVLSESLIDLKCETSVHVTISPSKKEEPPEKSTDIVESDENIENSGTVKDLEEVKVKETDDSMEVAAETRAEVLDKAVESAKETESKDDNESGEKDGANKVVEDSGKSSSSGEIQGKIDVNKMKICLRTKCANHPSEPSESSMLALPKKDAVLANALPPETGALMTKCANISITPSESSQPSGLTLPKEDAVLANALHPETGALIAAADDITEKTPDEALKDFLVQRPVGEYLLKKLEERLTEAENDYGEKEENAVDESESATGEASSSSSDNEEDDEKAGKDASENANKSAVKTFKKDKSAAKEGSKDLEEISAVAEDETLVKNGEKLTKKGETVLKGNTKTIETESERKDDKIASKEDENENATSEKEPVNKDETSENKDAEKMSEDKTVEEDINKTKEDAAEDIESVSQYLSKREDSSDKANSMQETGIEEPSEKEKTSEKVTKDSESEPVASQAKVQASDSKSSEKDSPSNPKRLKLSDGRESEVGTVPVKSRAALMRVKNEEILEEEVLNREVLKESNMVVVQKTVKTKRFEEDTVTPPPAPKRARKGVAHKALIIDRSDSPGQDELFPSMFLDPSVTITVLQESEKENGDSKEPVSNPPSVVEELRTSVNLSNDVSLTMVRPAVPLEGLAAAQDGAFSRISERNSVDILGVTSQSPAHGTRPRARKSFPRPSPRISTRSPQSLAQGSPSMEVKRLSPSVNGRDISLARVNAGSPLGRTLTSASSASSTLSMRVVSSQPPVPITSLAFSSSPTLSTASTSQPLVHSMVSHSMPSSSVMVTTSQGAGPSTSSARLPNLQPRLPNFPLSGPQPMYAPSEAGPVTGEFSKHAHKLANYMRGAIEEILGDLSRMGNSEAALKLLRLEVEKMRWEHQQEVAELKHNHDLVIVEMRNSVEKEKIRCINEVKRMYEEEKSRCIDETKKKQWCANCAKEALFYCCWNTSYCDYPCQQAHWPRHMSSCAQNNGMNESAADGDSGSSGTRKDGNSSGHKGMPGTSAAPPPFHQLHRPGGSTPQESLAEEEYYDEDSNSPSAPRMGTSGGTYRVKRRRCGLCKGCLVKNNCGSCAPCRNSKTHQVCRMRRCRSLQSDWVPLSGSSSGSTSRPITPEPAPLTVSLKTPPLTYASKRKRGNGRSPRGSSASSVGMTSTCCPNMIPQPNGENFNVEMVAATADASDTQIIPFGGSFASQSRQLPTSQSQPQASTMDLSSQPIGPPLIHPHILSQAMSPYIYPSPCSPQNNATPDIQCTHPSHSQPNYSQPNYSQPNYSQPNYSQPNYSQPNYSQPLSFSQPSSYTQPGSYSQPSSFTQPTSYSSQPPLLTQAPSHSIPPPMPNLHQERPPFPPLNLSQSQQAPFNSNSESQPSPVPTQNGVSPQFSNPPFPPPPLRKNGHMSNANSPSPSSYLQNPFLFPQYPQNHILQQPYPATSNIPPPTPIPKSRGRGRSVRGQSRRGQSNSGRARSRSRSSSPYANTRHPSPQPSSINSSYAILSSTSILMPPPSPQFFFPNSCDLSPPSLAERHQIHRQRMAAGVDIFTESMRFGVRPSYFV